nr:hypothetical protein EUGRSUZ_F00363 [Ipomoea batatas]
MQLEILMKYEKEKGKEWKGREEVTSAAVAMRPGRVREAIQFLGVPHGREQELSLVGTVRIVTRLCGVIYEDFTRISRVYDHSVHANVAVGRHQRRCLRAHNGLMKRPRAFPRALSLRVTHPGVRNWILPSRGFVSSARARAEPVHGNIFIRQDNGNRSDAIPNLGCQFLNLVILECLSKRAVVVQYLLSNHYSGGSSTLILVGGHPPRLHRRRRNVYRVKGLKKIDDYRALDGREIPVPYKINVDRAFQKGAIVVLEDKWLLLN